MSLLTDLIASAQNEYQNNGIKGLSNTVKQTTSWLKFQVCDKTVYKWARRTSTNIYEKEWDILILLDCARIDMLNEISDDYKFINEIDEHITPGTDSAEWMRYTFIKEYREEMAKTLHITANTKSHTNIEGDQFLHFEEVWRDGWDEKHNTILPRTVTDRAISLHREFKPERTIIHYMQPHTPFIPFPEVNSRELPGADEEGKYGLSVPELSEKYSRKELWDFHKENLRYVLDDIELLLSNIDGEKVVISADHGQALGENGKWGHQPGSTLECVRKVPWCITSASDSGDYQPKFSLDNNENTRNDISINKKLGYLGYK